MLSDADGATRATAAEVCRNFGLWQDRAMRGPVLVTNHGRPKTVLLSIENYERRCDASGEVVGPAAMAVERMAQGFVMFDERLRLISANRAACDHWSSAVAAMQGLSVAELFGRNSAAAVERMLMRVSVTHEARRAEIADATGDRTLDLHAFPTDRGVALLFDVLDPAAIRAAAERDALVALIDDAGAATARINLRGCLVEAGAGFAALCGDPGASRTLADLVGSDDRDAVADMAERVLSAGETLRLSVRLSGPAHGRSAMLAVSPTRSPAHAITGAVVMVTPMQAAPASLRMVG
ncbi:prevent-host-death family protein [Sphingomonas jejuensis]|uniref:Prevent-host-death family protein n=1 Tax=Sphingomonas jejuensis TaxID=904715 RepID=A0ABX0XIG5_9SPHN|nr:type II toxin-antitoxin system prevent-host-death family antitoxin [Sphingomonas jejuensis]NJC33025.1 prevent-host-death family protein [Sphingomonas jejuensis]